MSQVVEQISTEILERLLALENPSKEDVNKVKIEVCRKYKSPFVPANSSILELLSDDLRPRLRPVLTDKQVRGISGVTTVAVMPKPYGCPHGKCTYCPGGPACLHWKRARSHEGSRIKVRPLPTSQQSTIAATAHGPLCR